MVAKALRRVKANATTITSAIPVSKVLRRSRNPSTSTAVSRPPKNSIKPVPSRLRMPSTSVMMRATSVPVLFASKYATGRRPMWACTLARNSAIRRWPALDTSCVMAKPVTPCMTVAARTASTKGANSDSWCLPITLSIRYLDEVGSTRPQTRLITISTKPRASTLRRGRIISRMSGHNSRRRSDERFWGAFCGITAV